MKRYYLHKISRSLNDGIQKRLLHKYLCNIMWSNVQKSFLNENSITFIGILKIIGYNRVWKKGRLNRDFTSRCLN